MTTDWKQLLLRQRASLTDGKSANFDAGILYGHASLEPLLLKAIECLEKYGSEKFWSYGGFNKYGHQEAKHCLSEIKAELELNEKE